jgi:transcriptional regulator with XRE-family HTH domain
MRHPKLSDLYDVNVVTDFGRRLKMALAAKGWTQETLATLAGLRRQTISCSMRVSSPKPETVERYAAILRIAPERLDPSYTRRKAVEVKRRARKRRLAEATAAALGKKGDG